MIKTGWITRLQACIVRRRNPVLLLLVFGISGCAAIRSLPPGAAPEERLFPKSCPAMVRIAPEAFPSFSDGFNYDNLEYGIRNSLAYLTKRPPKALIYFGDDSYPVSHLIRSLTHFLTIVRQKPAPEALNRIIRTHYQVYQVTGKEGDGRVLVTGYYEPLLEGSLIRTKHYTHPIYSLPDDLITLDLSLFSPDLKGKRIVGRNDGKTIVPYYSRSEIEKNPDFGRKAKPIVWVKDRVDLFFLHIQGSGRIQLETDQTLHVHYHGANGRPYRSIGKLLLDQGKITAEEMSMQKIRSYLKQHPDQLDRVLHHNNSFVFFKVEDKGPLGNLGVALTPSRSAAFDRNLFPPAALAFIRTRIPVIDGDTNIAAWNDHQGFILNQDTGGAIKGPARADLFWGNGPYAEVAAGHLKSQGEIYFLILNSQSL